MWEDLPIANNATRWRSDEWNCKRRCVLLYASLVPSLQNTGISAWSPINTSPVKDLLCVDSHSPPSATATTSHRRIPICSPIWQRICLRVPIIKFVHNFLRHIFVRRETNKISRENSRCSSIGHASSTLVWNDGKVFFVFSCHALLRCSPTGPRGYCVCSECEL